MIYVVDVIDLSEPEAAAIRHEEEEAGRNPKIVTEVGAEADPDSPDSSMEFLRYMILVEK